jgi:tetratricopeptide (TPR) repeat protein
VIRLVAIALLPSAGAIAFALSSSHAANATSQKEENLYHEGMRLLLNKSYPEALEQFKRLERNAPQLPEGYTGEGIALALTGKPEEATIALHKAVTIDPHCWIARRELGIIDWKLNRKDEAVAELLAVIKVVPDDDSVSVILGEYSFEQKRYSEAVEFFAKARTQVTANTRLSLMASEALIRSGQSEDAVRRLNRLSAIPKLTSQERFQIAWLLGEAQEYSQAIQMFQALPADFPDSIGRDYGIALAYYESGQYAKCIGLLAALKDQGAGRAEIFSLLGAAEEANGQTREAYDAFRSGMERFPREDDNYLNSAIVAVQYQNYANAAQILTSGIQQMPGDYKLFLNRGVVYTLWGNLNKAEADYEKAVSLAPDDPSTYVALGICYMDKNQNDAAASILRQAIHRGLVDVRLNYYLADILIKQGLTGKSSLYYQEAIDAVNASIRVQPEFAYSYFQRARLELMAGHLQNAIVDFEHARNLKPDSTAIAYQLAIAYRDAGRKAEASRLFSQVSKAINEQDEGSRHRQSTLMNVMRSAADSRSSAADFTSTVP